ncbi:histidine kinase [Pseudomonas sp. GM18]|nr:histidine kinase [Pseudomonas sp. GM18]
MIRVNEAIDEALAESTTAYAEQVNHSRDIFLAILTLRGEEDSVRLTVHNDGVPIPAEAIVTIFDPLVRSAYEELGQPSTSFGLGLFIVKEVVDAHQDTIEVTSSEADGTLFTVTLTKNAPAA